MSNRPNSNSVQSALNHVKAEVIKVGNFIQNSGFLIFIQIDLGLSGRRAEYPERLNLDELKRTSPRLVDAAERKFWLLVILLLGGISTTATLFLREQGVLQRFELSAFDHLMRLRPHERPDPRLLVVTVSESDIQRYKEGSISDSTLSKLLAKLEESQPRVIGLDIYRNFPVVNGHRSLSRHFESPRLIATCAGATRGKKGVSGPPGIPRERLGFSDVVMDNDGVLRRHLLLMQPDLDSLCKTNEALSFQLALHYLAGEGIQAKLTEKDEYRIEKVLFTPLTIRRGGYRQLDTRGYQVLLNYRSMQSPEQVAERVTLSQVLNGNVNPKRIKDRLVLIGVAAESVKDDHLTPYSDHIQPPQRSSGVFVQAQMVSQVLSAVLDGRPLLWVWPDWAEMFWIVSWSVIGGVVGMVVRSRLQFFLFISASVVVLIAMCWGGLLYGGWLPLVPSALVLLITGSIVFVVQLQSQPQN